MKLAEKNIARERPIRDRHEATATLAEFREGLDAHPSWWRGMAGATDRAVMEAVLSIGMRCSKLAVGVSWMEAADEANVSRKAAGAALDRLRTPPAARPALLTLPERGDGRRPHIYRVQTDAVGTPQTNPYRGYEESHARPSVDDLWRWEGLGKSKAQVYAVLDRDQPRCSVEIAKVLGVVPRTIDRHLSKLERFDLAERTGDGWITGRADPAEIATQIGVPGRGALQRQQHSAYRHSALSTSRDALRTARTKEADRGACRELLTVGHPNKRRRA